MADRETLQDIARQCVILSGDIAKMQKQMDDLELKVKEIYSKTIEALDVT